MSLGILTLYKRATQLPLLPLPFVQSGQVQVILRILILKALGSLGLVLM
jgi:hypothetical protein